MPPPRKRLNRAFLLFFILPYSLVASLPPKPDDLGPVLAGRDVDSTALTFDSQIDQSGSVTGSPIVELFPTGETTSKGKLEDILLGYGDGNSQAELISADPSEISRCRQNPTGLNQVSSRKRRFKRQKNDQCLPDANLAKPGVVEQKVPVKDQIPGQLEDDQKPRDPGLHWAPFFQIQKPQPGRTNEGKCSNLEYQVAVCYARMRSSIVPDMSLLGGLMGMLDPVSLDQGFGCAAGEDKYCCSFVLPHVDADRLQVVPVPSPGVQAEITANLDRWSGYTCVKQVKK